MAPLSDFASAELAAKLLGVALLMFAFSPFVLAGHYDLYRDPNRTGARPRTTTQEGVAAAISALLIGGGAGWMLI